MRKNPRQLSDATAAVAFVRVVECGSFRGAAELLRLPSSTVSRRVAALEEEVGVRLLDRTTRTQRLTDAGRSFFAEAGPAVAALDRAAQSAVDRGERPHGLVRLTAPVMFGQIVLSQVLAALMKQHPQIDLAVDLEDRPMDLVREGFDLAIRTGDLTDSALVARRLGDTAIGVYASPSYLQRRGVPRTLAALSEHDILANGTIERTSPWRFVLDGRPVTVEVRPRATVNNFIVLRALCIEGLGIARLPRFFAQPAAERGELSAVLTSLDPPPVAVAMVWPPGRRLPARTRAVIDVLATAIPVALARGPSVAT